MNVNKSDIDWTRERFSTRLKDLRKANGKNQTDVAKWLGVTREMISNYEKDKSTDFADGINLLADKFGVSADYLLGRTQNYTQDIKIQAICNYTGLSQETVELLHRNKAIYSRQKTTEIIYKDVVDTLFNVNVVSNLTEETFNLIVSTLNKISELSKKIKIENKYNYALLSTWRERYNEARKHSIALTEEPTDKMIASFKELCITNSLTEIKTQYTEATTMTQWKCDDIGRIVASSLREQLDFSRDKEFQTLIDVILKKLEEQ